MGVDNHGYRIYRKYSDRQAWANNLDTDDFPLFLTREMTCDYLFASMYARPILFWNDLL